MSTEETQQDQAVTEETQQVSEETTIEQDIEANLKESAGEETLADPAGDIEVTDEEIEAELAALNTETLNPPPKWDRRYKEAFEDLGKVEGGSAYQQAMIDLYNDQQGYATQIEQERAQLRKFAEPLQGALEPYQQFIAQSGATPDQMIRQAMGLVMRLSQNPQATIQGLAQRAGIDLNQIGQDAPYVDPQVQQLEAEMRRMKQSQLHERQKQMEQWQQQQVAQIQQQIDTFTKATDDNGNPKYPHLELVEGEMAMILKGNPNVSLEDAYSKACKLSDEVTQAQEAQNKAREAARKAAKAKKEAAAAQRVSGQPGVDAPTDESIEDTIRKAWREQQAA